MAAQTVATLPYSLVFLVLDPVIPCNINLTGGSGKFRRGLNQNGHK